MRTFITLGLTVALLAACSAPWEGMSESDIGAWKALGVDSEAAQQWRGGGFSASAAEGWLAQGFDAATAGAWRSEDFSPSEARAWIDGKFKLKDAVARRAEGLTPTPPAAVEEAMKSLGSVGSTP